jgi:hypothetical protein
MSGGWDGHEIAFVSTIGGCAALVHRTMPAGWMRSFVHRQPVAAMACLWGVMGVTLPLVVPRLRRTLRLPTNQYDAHHPKAVFPKY